MKTKTPPEDRTTKASGSAAKSDLCGPFTAGVAGWLIGTLLLFGLAWPVTHPTSIANAMMWALSQSWAGFLFGLLLLIGFGLVRGRGIAKAAMAYLVPVLVLAAITGICLLIYPDRSLREELLTSLPVVWVFYVLAVLWMKTRGASADDSQFARAVIPGVLGGAVVLAFVAVPAFASDAFRYHDAFVLNVAKMTPGKGSVLTECVLVIRKPGNYDFSAPWYREVYSMGEEELQSVREIGEITWGKGGKPKGDVPGEYPFQIVWHDNNPTAGASPDALTKFSPYQDYVCIEVRNVDEESRLVHTIEVPIEEPSGE